MSPAIPQSIELLLPDAELQTLLEATINHFGCAAGTVHLMSAGVLKLAAHFGIPAAVVRIVESVAVGKGIAGLAAERREAVTICNLQTDTSGQARPGARITGMEGSIAVPMLANETLTGVLGIAKPTAHDWTPEETSVLLAIAKRIAERPHSDRAT